MAPGRADPHAVEPARRCDAACLDAGARGEPVRCYAGRVRGWLAIVLLAGCGRIGFDPTEDAGAVALVHDEDGDLIDDDGDNCPFLANTDQADQDGDRVGDACDREPANARQHLTYFNALRPSDPALTVTGFGTWTRGPDGYLFDGDPPQGRNGQLTANVPVTDAEIWLGATIRSRVATAPGWQVAIALVDQTANNPYYYGQLYDDASNRVLSVSEWTGSNYFDRGNQALASGVHPGEVDLLLAVRTQPLQIDVIGGWPGERYQTAAVAPNYASADRIVIPIEGLVLELHYLAIVTTN